jgi:hypothetical protein
MGLLLLMGGGANRLLDQYPATVGYSLRRIRTAYSGACLRLRRSSDSAEQDIGFAGGVLDTASALSFCGAGNGFVATWYDQMGSNNAVQATTTLQPQLVASGAMIVNEVGKPALRSVDSSAVAIGPHLAFDPWYVNSQSYVGMFVSYSLLVSGSFPFIVNTSPVDRGIVAVHNSTTRNIRLFAIRTSARGGNGSVIPLNTTTILHQSANRTKLFGFLNTTQAADIDLADGNENFNMPTKVWLMSGDSVAPTAEILMNEFIGYTADQSANQLAIRTNMSNYWGA